MKNADGASSEANAYYSFRIRKREAKLVGVIGFLWFLWSQAGELRSLFGGLLGSLG